MERPLQMTVSKKDCNSLLCTKIRDTSLPSATGNGVVVETGVGNEKELLLQE